MGYPSMEEIAQIDMEGNISFFAEKENSKVLTGMVICQMYKDVFNRDVDVIDKQENTYYYPYIKFQIGDQDLEGKNLGKDNEPDFWNYFDNKMITTAGIVESLRKLDPGSTYSDFKKACEEYVLKIKYGILIDIYPTFIIYQKLNIYFIPFILPST